MERRRGPRRRRPGTRHRRRRAARRRRRSRGDRGAPARPQRRDLRNVATVIASGGVFRHADRDAALAAFDPTLRDHAGGWALPRSPRVTVDDRYVLAAAGLLAGEHPAAAAGLLRAYVHSG
ncbi:glutamate mutase L [Dactylosporangium sp. NBC_01737]|nr:glutamate mutase L [Dactylosporangium sp. NBC_01737]